MFDIFLLNRGFAEKPPTDSFFIPYFEFKEPIAGIQMMGSPFFVDVSQFEN
jgi:hypothetical protein